MLVPEPVDIGLSATVGDGQQVSLEPVVDDPEQLQFAGSLDVPERQTHAA